MMKSIMLFLTLGWAASGIAAAQSPDSVATDLVIVQASEASKHILGFKSEISVIQDEKVAERIPMDREKGIDEPESLVTQMKVVNRYLRKGYQLLHVSVNYPTSGNYRTTLYYLTR